MQELDFNAATRCHTSGLLTATGAVTTHDTTVTIAYAIKGQAYTKTAITTGATPTTDVNTSAAFVALAVQKACVFVWMLNSAGTVAVAQSNVVDTDATGTIRTVHPQFPKIPDGYCPFAYHFIGNSSAGSSWTFGTSNWNATGITKLIVNVSELPARPVTTVTA